MSGVKSGYNFAYVSGAPDATGYISTYALNVNPSAPGQSGVRFFYSDQSGVINYAYGAPATSSDAAF